MNEGNLKPFTKDTARQNGSKGGKAGGKRRRELKTMREALEALLAMPAPDAEENETCCEAVVASLIRKALAGDVRAAEFVRDTLYGKPAVRAAVDMTATTTTRLVLFGETEETAPPAMN